MSHDYIGYAICASHLSMISAESPLRRLPSNIDREQAFFLDSFRHAFDISHIAFERLHTTLTELVPEIEQPSSRRTHLISSAYLDAWAMIDAADRFDGLWRVAEDRFGFVSKADGEQDVASAVRKLRNVADHLASRTEFVLARRGTSLGVLSWFTAFERQPIRGHLCAILPGSAIEIDANIGTPHGRAIRWPTGAIWLESAGNRVCLDDVAQALEKRTRALEAIIQPANLVGTRSDEILDVDVIVKTIVCFEQ